MKKNKSFLLLICLIFILNFFTFNVYALNSGTSSRAIGNVNIVSTVDTSLEAVEAWARSKNATETFVGLAKLYKQYAASRGGVNWVLAYVQAAKETGYGKFGGVLDESYHNPCGLKNPSGGGDYDPNAHKKFDNWEQGILAHLDHLALYAAANGYPKTTYVDKWKDEVLSENETYDPRHTGWFGTTSGILGKAKDVLSLTGSWASDPNYGVDLFRLYCDATNSEYLPTRSNLEAPSDSEIITNGKLRVKGWALHSFGIKEIKVLVNNSQVTTINTGVSRPDVNSAYPGYFNGDVSGFDQTIDISALGTGNKTVEVIIVARNGETQSYKRNIVVKGEESVLPSRSSLDDPTPNQTITSNTLKVRGWALDSSGIKEVRVFVDGKDFGTVNYGTTRTDVNKAYPGYPSGNNSGFEGIIDTSSLSSGNKKVVVKITSNSGAIQELERTITIAKLQSRASLDEPANNDIAGSTTLKIRGWALDSSGVKEVRVYVDGKDLGTVTYGTTRTDVNKAYPGYSSGDNAGFEGFIDISSINTGNKKLSVKITSNDGTVQTLDRTINVKRLESRSSLDEPNNNITAKGSLKIRGWAVASSGIKEVRVYVDGKDLGTVTYGTTRTDVNKAYPGYSSGNNAGFEGTVNISSISSGSKKLTVKITANDGTVEKIERTIKIEGLESITCLDEPANNEIVNSNTLKIRGWAVASSGVKEVRVYVDGKDLGTVKYGTERKDVNIARPGYPSGNYSGYEGNINISSINSGDKKIKIKVTANDGTIQELERTIKVKRLESIVCLDNPSSNEIITSNTLKIRGWAVASSGVKEVRVYVDGKDLGTIKYGTERKDVNIARPGYPSGDYAGFDGTVNISSINSGNKKVKIKVTANDGTTQEIERTINIQKLESITCLDSPTENEVVSGNSLKVRGWALASSGVKEVRAYIDGKDLGTVEYGTERKDVNIACPGYPSGNYPGFDGSIDISNVGSGNKKLVLKIVENNGDIQTIERNFVYRKTKLVVVDPGHEIESVDPGASATHNGIRYIEGNLNLQIAVKLKAELEALGIEVYMTRYDGIIIDRDSTESLKKRVKVANEMNADLFVSIHHNSFTTSSANGFEVYYSTGTPITSNMIPTSLITKDGRDLTLERTSYATRSLEEKVQVSKALATAITNTASSELGMYNRGAKDSNLYVCKNTTMPSVLIENGFLTNPTEAVKVSKDSHQQKLAKITAQKINEALN